MHIHIIYNLSKHCLSLSRVAALTLCIPLFELLAAQRPIAAKIHFLKTLCHLLYKLRLAAARICRRVLLLVKDS